MLTWEQGNHVLVVSFRCSGEDSEVTREVQVAVFPVNTSVQTEDAL